MSGFLFCTYSYFDQQLSQPLTVVYTTTRATFESEGCIDDGYEDEDWDRLLEAGYKHRLGELMESVYETPLSPDEVVSELGAEVDFEHSLPLLDFILRHDPFGESPYQFPAGVTPQPDAA